MNESIGEPILDIEVGPCRRKLDRPPIVRVHRPDEDLARLDQRREGRRSAQVAAIVALHRDDHRDGAIGNHQRSVEEMLPSPSSSQAVKTSSNWSMATTSRRA
jgi:hypothetical protein